MCFVPYASLVVIWILTLVFSSFYEENESLPVLLATEQPAGKFLKWKITTHLGLYLQFIIPAILVYSIINYQTWHIAVIVLLLCMLNFVFFIVSKYTVYLSETRQPINISVIMLVLMDNLLSPFYLF
ncbi:MAG: hypothetical protein LBL90_13940 [Prevotellaceae bacterium]|jgi:hypothetical protein|nr:hypothetical protein [Prevotellaceae bacterium]